MSQNSFFFFFFFFSGGLFFLLFFLNLLFFFFFSGGLIFLLIFFNVLMMYKNIFFYTFRNFLEFVIITIVSKSRFSQKWKSRMFIFEREIGAGILVPFCANSLAPRRTFIRDFLVICLKHLIALIFAATLK